MSESENEATQASEPERLSDDATMIADILNDVPIQDRDTMVRFYAERQTHQQIEAAVGLDEDHFRDLRCSVKAKFLKRSGR